MSGGHEPSCHGEEMVLEPSSLGSVVHDESMGAESRCDGPSHDGAAQVDEALGPKGEAKGRFSVGPEIGVGGMGRVSLVRDQRLLRDVAWKRGDWWLLREARILAQLEHPGIVPIHDMGFDESGRPYFAMRVVKGRSLSELLRETPSSERLQLLRPLLQAAEAVAFAHHRGVVHRDLKPANIMIGRFGESQVVDWGLARVLDDGEDPIPAEVACAVSGRESGRIGTPGYMSPEQTRGETADRRSDVYGLGRILARILDLDAESSALEVPLELRAIIAKSTAERPDERYGDAAAFAADLERYLDGRRVSAHTYGQRELFRRFVRRHRVALAVAVVGAVALVVLGVLFVFGIDAERVVAERAAAATQAALAQSDAHLARSLVGEARRLVGQGARAEAEVLAAHSLMLAEDPDARGVLSSLSGAPELELVWRRELECPESQVEASRELVVCSHPEGLEVWDVSSEPARKRWSREMPIRLARSSEGGVVVGASLDAVVVMFDWEGREIFRGRSTHSMTRKSASDGMLAAFVSATMSMMADFRARQIHNFMMCGEVLHAALAVRDEGPGHTGDVSRVLGLCKDGTLVRGERRVATELIAPEREGVLMNLMADERVVVGTTKGEVVVLDGEGRLVSARRVVPGMVRLLTTSPEGTHVAVAGEGDPILILTLPDLAPIASLPRRAKSVAWDTQRPGELVSTGRRVERWRLGAPDALRPLLGAHMIPLADGVVALDIDPATPGRIAVSFGPHLGVLEPQRMRSRELGIITVKGGSFDGERIMLAGGKGVFALDGEDLELVGDGPIVRWAVRRFVTLSDGTKLVGAYSSLRRWNGDFVIEAEGPTLDLAVSPNRRFAVFLREADRSFVRVRAGELGAEELGADVLAEAATIGVDGDRIYTARAGSVAEWDELGHLLGVYEAGDSKLIDVEVSGDGAWVAAGGREGTVWVWSVGRSQARARFSDHTERVPALVFSTDSKFLISGSWDRTLRVRDLEVVAAPIGAISQELYRRYAMGLKEALGGL